MAYTAHVDTFARDNLPPRPLWPEFRFDLPDLQFPAQLNCATELLDKMVAAGYGERPVIHTMIDGRKYSCTYAQLLTRANQIAHVIQKDMKLVPGTRVLPTTSYSLGKAVDEEIAGLSRLKAIPGVTRAEMVCHYFEDGNGESAAPAA